MLRKALFYTGALCESAVLLARLLPAHARGAVERLLVSGGARGPAHVRLTPLWLGGVLLGLALFVEDTHRRGELAMYVLPKGMESAWVMARGRGWVLPLGMYGSPLLTAIGMGMVMVRLAVFFV